MEPDTFPVNVPVVMVRLNIFGHEFSEAGKFTSPKFQDGWITEGGGWSASEKLGMYPAYFRSWTPKGKRRSRRIDMTRIVRLEAV